MRKMASQWDKSADLFTLTARSENCFSDKSALTSALQLLQVQKQKMAEGATGQADRTVRRHTAAARIVVPWQEFESAQVLRDAADGVAGERAESTFHKPQVQPIEQPSAEEFGDEAA